MKENLKGNLYCLEKIIEAWQKYINNATPRNRYYTVQWYNRINDWLYGDGLDEPDCVLYFYSSEDRAAFVEKHHSNMSEAKMFLK
jgi:hypothetical protein